MPRRGPAIGRPAAGLADLRRQRPADRLRDEPRGRQDAVERDAVLPARRVEEVHEVLRGEVARRARRVRAAAGPAGRRVEAADAGVEAGRDVGEGRAARVVEVEGDPLEWDPGVDGQSGQGRDLARHADPDRVAEADLVEPRGPAGAGRRRRPGEGRRGRRTGSRRRSRRRRAATSRASSLVRGPARRPSSDSATVIPMLAWVKASVAAVKTAIASTPAASARSRPRTFGHEDRVANAGPPVDGRRAAPRRRRAAGSRAATRSSWPRSRAGRRRRGGR